MRILKIFVLLIFAAALVLPFTYTSSVEGQAATEAPTTEMDARQSDATLYNGFITRDNGGLGNAVNECTNPALAGRSFRDNKAIFEEREGVADGLGPTYNDVACSACHQAPVTGHVSQINEFRAADGNGNPPPGGQTLIQDRAIDPDAQERINTGLSTHEFRSTRTVLGDGFVEAIGNATLQNNVAAQPSGQRGQLRTVTVLESTAADRTRIGRFGHKSQHASLESFSADAYLNEMGITSPLQPNENNILGQSSAPFDTVADPEDDGDDVAAFTDFMRALRAPGRGPINADVIAGQNLFNAINCDVCHTPQFTTVPAGTVINAGAFTVPNSLANKIIHPFSDFALHNIGTSDGIGGEPGVNDRFSTTTIALWGVRTKHRFMMQGNAHTIFDSIQLHAGQASTARNNFNFGLNNTQKNQVIAFVLSL
ncbi:MAG TPA: di-heme oxidoredictase family protein [Blastocatellia bacterium]|nr:di-heme oxidoredictase family protein [Blastocatellia bacterium]